jgi:hypothetical protein
MRRARPYRGENPEPGKDVTESLTPRPELENGQDPNATSASYSTSLSSCAKSLSGASGNAVRRREFFTLIGAATAWPVAARGQKASKLPTIGFSWSDPKTPSDRERVR